MNQSTALTIHALGARIIAALALFALPACTASDPNGNAPATAESDDLHEIRFQVDGMHCGSCAEAITAELASDTARQRIAVSHETRVAVYFVADVSPEGVESAAAAVRKLGFIVTPLAPGSPAGPVVTPGGPGAK